MPIKYQISPNSAHTCSFKLIVSSDKPIDLKSLQQIKMCPEEKQALDELVKGGFKAEEEAGAVAFYITRLKASKILYVLALSRALYFEEKKIFYDPFSQSNVHFEVKREKENFVVTGVVTAQNSTTFLHECDLVFEGDKIFFLQKSVLSSISTECDFEWLEKVLEKPLVLSKQQLDEFQEELKRDNLAPKVIVDADVNLEPLISCLPLLKLHDQAGVYASLIFDYGTYGQVKSESFEKLKIQRNEEEEKSWEEDLIEAGYIKKRGPFSSFYCPQEKISKSLRFLLELGWKVLDKSDREVKLVTDQNISVSKVEQNVELKGDLQFDTQSISLQETKSALDRHESFVQLSENSVGLLEGVTFLKDIPLVEDYSEKPFKLSLFDLGLIEELEESSFDQELKTYLKCVKKQLHHKQPSEDFQGKLLPYQELGFDWLCQLFDRGFSGLLADEMGLGKTVQVLAFLAHVGRFKQHLIVVPTALKCNWVKECEKFLDTCPHVFTHKDDEVKSGITIVSYAMLKLYLEKFSKFHFDTVILDEAQMIKNPDTLVAKAVCKLSSSFKLCMTGTPIENKALDLWSIFQFLEPRFLEGRKAFESIYQQSKAIKKLSKKVNPYILRRQKHDVLKDLPKRIDQDVYIEMSDEEKSLYQKMLTSSKDIIQSSSSKLKVFELLLRLRQLCCHPILAKCEADSSKLFQVVSDIKELAESNRKVLLFSQFTSMLSLIKKALLEEGISFLYIDGSTKNRQEIVDTFQEGEVDVLLMSLKAGGVGLNITSADTVMIYDPWWNSAQEEQAIARAHRIGQEKTVFVKRYIMAMSIEEKIMQLKESKQKVFSEVISEDKLTLEELHSLL